MRRRPVPCRPGAGAPGKAPERNVHRNVHRGLALALFALLVASCAAPTAPDTCTVLDTLSTWPVVVTMQQPCSRPVQVPRP